MVANKSAAKPAAKGAVPDRLLLVDGSGYIFRAYHALPPLTRKKDGLPTGAVAGFCNMLHKLLQDTFTDGDGTHIAVIFDAGRVTFRNDIYPDYKANRDAPPEDLVPQFEIIRDATRAFNVATIARKGFEADDLIATYARVARAAGAEVIIVSSDKDLMQLVGDGVRMFDPMKNRSIGPDEVREKFGVAPEKVIDVQALAGDSSDNVPGVPGIGVKTAAQLIGEYGDLDTLLSRAGEIKQPKRRESLIENADLARISRDLVTLRDDVEITETFDDFDYRRPDPGTLLAFLDVILFSSSVLVVSLEVEDTRIPTVKGYPGRSGWQSQGSQSPMDARTHRGNWCNISGAGIGERPRANPRTGVDAYYWIKPPGESDGTSAVRPYEPSEAIPTDALSGAPHAGHWFHEQLLMLVENATPAL